MNKYEKEGIDCTEMKNPSDLFKTTTLVIYVSILPELLVDVI